ncbi:uncharacterized protein C2845_PM01G32700 [Panicum miliaceum]|uniref:Uncharacterized protein n=1 Tax=Panicum miliaceum TaxID=4540 RepID=A0A3L6TGS8_PANMI|nr:uncharacterized protein C2845_PM01G32700 [Panicum miliaceum]
MRAAAGDGGGAMSPAASLRADLLDVKVRNTTACILLEFGSFVRGCSAEGEASQGDSGDGREPERDISPLVFVSRAGKLPKRTRQGILHWKLCHAMYINSSVQSRRGDGGDAGRQSLPATGRGKTVGAWIKDAAGFGVGAAVAALVTGAVFWAPRAAAGAAVQERGRVQRHQGSGGRWSSSPVPLTLRSRSWIPRRFRAMRPLRRCPRVGLRLGGSVGQNKLASFVIEGAQGGPRNLAKHKRRPPVQRWRPISTEAVPQKDDVNEISNSGSRRVIEDGDSLRPGHEHQKFHSQAADKRKVPGDSVSPFTHKLGTPEQYMTSMSCMELRKKKKKLKFLASLKR